MRATRADGVTVELLDDGTWMTPNASSTEDTSAPVNGDGFRDVPWGTAPDRAKLREGTAPDQESSTILAWSGVQLADLTCEVVHIYAQNKLVRGKYLVTDTWLNENRYLTEFESLKSLLQRKYGKPDSDDSFWSNTLWEDDPNDWGKAVERGHLSFFARWERGDTRVLLHLTGENYESKLGIEYASLSLELLEQHDRESATLDDL